MQADIGIAVDGATDAARAAADIVLTTPGLGVIVDAIVLSRCIFNRMKNYVVYRIACTFQLLVFFFCGVMFMHPMELAPQQKDMPAYFNLPVVALIIITILNDGTNPPHPNLPVVAHIIITILNDGTNPPHPNGTALSLITRSFNGNTVRSFPTHGQLSAAQGSLTSCLNFDFAILNLFEPSAL